MKPLYGFTSRGVALGLVLAACVTVGCGCTRSEPVSEEKVPQTPKSVEAVAPAPTAIESQLAQGKQLYQRHCAACHGDQGDGNGPASAFLFPRPRNFQRAEFRLVTTENRVPSDEDLVAVLDRGMPGSAMLSFAHLPEQDRQALIRYIHHLTAEGVRQRLTAEAAEFGEKPDPAELKQIVGQQTAPGGHLTVPELPVSTAEAVARGEQIYQRTCATCHGKTGKGDGVQTQVDTEGRPTRPRDLTLGIYKGRPEPADIYARVRLGMPGTPMPSDASMSDQEVGDLIQYLLSLSDPMVRERTVMRRTSLTARRMPETLTVDPNAPVWDTIEPVRLTMTPLWWHDYEDLSLNVQAVHDGSTLALRLTWRDSTQNDRAVRLQDFEDMVAVQLYQGSQEPFLGMGATDAPVDVWLWRAAWQADQQEYADVDTSYPKMNVDWYPFEGAKDGSRPHATEHQPREFITALAAGNLQSDPERKTAVGSLESGGFGTLTMRPRVSQAVTASGQKAEDSWTVVLLRPLAVAGDAGIPLAAGQKVSIAFAVWDGVASDRNGQKRVTIWHDLILE